MKLVHGNTGVQKVTSLCIYSITRASMARILMAHSPWLARTNMIMVPTGQGIFQAQNMNGP